MLLRAIQLFFAVQAIILVIGLNVGSSIAAESRADACSRNLRQFVEELDQVLTRSPDSVVVVDGTILKFLPIEGCDVDEVMAISKKSDFFSEVFEQTTSYSIAFRSGHYIVSFGLRKGTGNIEYPNARVRYP